MGFLAHVIANVSPMSHAFLWAAIERQRGLGKSLPDSASFTLRAEVIAQESAAPPLVAELAAVGQVQTNGWIGRTVCSVV